jgi:2-amino-4-hydroxy-6-hydroxymethyldihydropteridine diphosphokinase
MEHADTDAAVSSNFVVSAWYHETMTTVRAYLGLGSNLGERAAHLEDAISRLNELGRVVARSNMLETAPWGYADQPDFLNMVVGLETDLSPRDLLAAVKRIERDMGRTPTFRNGPRVVDIDILLYGDRRVDEPGLVIPHPRMGERAFVLEPLAEIAPELAARHACPAKEEDADADVSL